MPYGYRTDLAMESLEMSRRACEKADTLPGVRSAERTIEGFPVTSVEILNDEGANRLGKPTGVYHTLLLDALMRREEDAFPRACRALQQLVRPLLPAPDGAALIIGLGNRQITPDAIGPRTADYVIATRHLTTQVPDFFADWRPVSALAPGVLGQTGVEAQEIVSAVVQAVKPAVVVAVDALAAGSMKRLCRTVQLTDAGIVPGSGVQNARAALNRDTLGVPVLALGVPTVVDGASLAAELGQPAAAEWKSFLVTTRDIDREAADLSRLLGYALNLALQPDLELEDIDLYLA